MVRGQLTGKRPKEDDMGWTQVRETQSTHSGILLVFFILGCVSFGLIQMQFAGFEKEMNGAKAAVAIVVAEIQEVDKKRTGDIFVIRIVKDEVDAIKDALEDHKKEIHYGRED